jgi:L-glutamine:2-deoxy-scyllo-inosose/3-amino-2,3-dideoxy-scyllo-inosose aminotransferase
LGMGDEVIVSDYTFVASASAVVAVNAVPVFCDIDPETLVLDVDKFESLITSRTRAVIAVHLGGNPVEMDRLCEIASKNGLKVVEDCAHAHGSRYRGKRAGNWGDAGTFSFQASKVLKRECALSGRSVELDRRDHRNETDGRCRGDWLLRISIHF